MATVACAPPSLFQRHFNAHHWVEAAEAFDADSSLAQDEEALFSAALLHGRPGTPVYDPDRARALLERMLYLHPRSDRRGMAVQVLPMLDELRRVQDLERREQELRGNIADLTREIADLRRVRDALLTHLASEQDQRESARRAVDRLESNLRERDDQLRTLRTELTRLKSIDLRQP